MSDKINVLFLQAQSDFKADSTIHSHLMRHLDRAAFTVHAACTPTDGLGVSKSIQAIGAIPDVHVRPTQFAPGFRQRTPLELLLGLRGAALFPLDLVALRNYVARERIHLIHSSERPRDSLYNVGLSRTTSAKSVIHVHVKWTADYSAQARWAVQRADGVFSISQYVTNTIVSLGTPPERIHTILNCIETSRWDPSIDGSAVRREFGISDGTPLLVSVSRLFSWKGQRELLKALRLVRDDVPDVRLLIVGEDEVHVHGGSFTVELESLARSLGVRDLVTFTGLRSDIPELMAACDVFTMPSFEEPFGVVFLEAMAMRRPVIAVGNGGTPEVVKHGATGLLSPSWDVPALAKNIVTLLKDRELRMRMGEAGRALVLERFNPRRMASDAAHAYEKILGR